VVGTHPLPGRVLAALDEQVAGLDLPDRPTSSVPTVVRVDSAGGIHRARQAARSLTDSLVPAPGPAMADTLVLVVSKLVINAVRHGGGRYSLELSAGPDTVTAAVSDPNPALPHERTPDLNGGIGGFGWHMVRRLTSHLSATPGTSPSPGPGAGTAPARQKHPRPTPPIMRAMFWYFAGGLESGGELVRLPTAHSPWQAQGSTRHVEHALTGSRGRPTLRRTHDRVSTSESALGGLPQASTPRGIDEIWATSRKAG
jgi:hypothetical protein